MGCAMYPASVFSKINLLFHIKTHKANIVGEQEEYLVPQVVASHPPPLTPSLCDVC